MKYSDENTIQQTGYRDYYLLLLQLVCFWPVWRWYALRITDGSDDPWGGLALVAAIVLLHINKRQPVEVNESLYLPAALTFLYAVSYIFLSPLLRAIIAITAVAILLSRNIYGYRLKLSILGLFLLSLPLTASLQFYLGYPLRSLTASIAAPVIRLGGLPVIAEGVSLNWNNKSILIDAPCSGVKMLWVGLFLACTLSNIFKLDNTRSFFAIIISIILVFLGNLMRSMALFYVESDIFKLPEWTHTGIGIISFLYTAIFIAFCIKKLRMIKPCET